MSKKAKKLLILLAAAQFIFTLDSTVMNVSISTLVQDLHTTVGDIQAAIAFYSLVMAAFMIAGAKIGDIIGRKRAFIVGMCIYGVGSSLTALAPNVQVLKFGWSFLEGIGAALAIPAMLSLIAGNFTKPDHRLKAYSTVAAMAGIAAGLGPIIGGFLTTYATWRLAFAGEVLVVIWILFQQGLIKDVKLEGKKMRLDKIGVILSVAGLGVMVQGILMAGTYGLLRARQDYVLGSFTFTAGGISPAIVGIVVGICILIGFAVWEAHQFRKGKDQLINLDLFKIPAVSGGTLTILSQQFVLGGLMYVMALFLQIQQGMSAFQTGIVLLPLSLCLLLAASRGNVLAKRFDPRDIIRVGYLLILIGVLVIAARSRDIAADPVFPISLAVAGAGIGLIGSQLQNLVQSSVTKEQSGEASGLMSTFQNLGMSLGTAIAGVVLTGFLISVSTQLIGENTTLTGAQKQQYTSALQAQAQIVSDSALQSALDGESPETAQQVVQINAQARAQALTYSFVTIAVLGALGMAATTRLPRRTVPSKA